MKGRRKAKAWYARGSKVHRTPKVMARVRRLLELKYGKKLTTAEVGQIVHNRERQKMLRLVVA